VRAEEGGLEAQALERPFIRRLTPQPDTRRQKAVPYGMKKRKQRVD
jgi:hypothetical protein